MAVVALFMRWWPGSGPGVVEGGGKGAAVSVCGAWRSAQGMRLDVVGACEPCDAEGRCFALRRRERDQSPLILRLRRLQSAVIHGVCGAAIEAWYVKLARRNLCDDKTGIVNGKLKAELYCAETFL